ncbi:pentapeptide repeat-containing protein [Trichocoleus desertorum AS-A10]|uniref:pentapeptide repeat-containing protein n=1 Tax=Trichocoleus desertorum TaxID=1481672 RepID=UPI0032983DC2
MNRIKPAHWLIIPAMFVVGLVEYNIHEQSIKADYRRLDSSNKAEENRAVESLVAGCRWQKPREHFSPSSYWKERLLGNCRPLDRVQLKHADLTFARLRRARLRHANLSYANLISADLSHAKLDGADLRYADLGHADLISADLSHADLSHADLRYAKLDGADLRYAKLSGTTLNAADLREANLDSANLSGADLTTIYPEFAYLRHAKLVPANFDGANLRNTNLSAAFLLVIDLRKVKNLTAAQLEGEKPPYLCNVALPPNIRGIDPNRNCDALPQIYNRRHSIPLEVAQTIVDKARKMQW